KEADSSLAKHKILELDFEPKIRTQVFKKVSDEKANTQDSSKNTKFAKQPIAEILSKIGETIASSKPVTSNSVSTPQVSKGVNNAKVIAPGMFRISSDKSSREAKKVTNTVSASSRTKPITVLQPSVITKKGINSNSNGLSSTGLDNTKTRRPQPRYNTKTDRVPSASKSSRSLNKDVKVEEHHRNLLLSKKNKHSSSACNNSKIDSLDVISKVVCAIFVSQDIISVVQKTSVVDTSNLQTELERTKERFENYIIIKENEYAKLWNDWSNTKNDRVSSVSKSSRSKNKEAKVEEHHRNLLLSKNTKHMSSACNNIKLDSHNVISKVVCAMCKQCLISVNHDVCLRNYVNGKTSRGKKK
nr:hypothetical protein [Tanacetum cinerariifolium]